MTGNSWSVMEVAGCGEGCCRWWRWLLVVEVMEMMEVKEVAGVCWRWLEVVGDGWK